MSSGKRKEFIAVYFLEEVIVAKKRIGCTSNRVGISNLDVLPTCKYLCVLVDVSCQPKVFQSCSLQAATSQSVHDLRLSSA
jgi:hypothetical protein